MKIILTECDTGNFMTFPMLPEEIKVECVTRFQSYDIMNIGEIMQPLGEELTRMSWSCKIPGEKRQVKNDKGIYQNPYIIVSHGDPLKVQSWFSYLRNKGIKCRLLITETPVNHDVYLESYTMTYAGGFGDYDCDISFVHAKDLKVATEGAEEKDNNGGTAKAVTPQEQQRPEKKADTSYTVKKGDCLWDIAQLKLGAGNRYTEIATLNHISNPNQISVGQVLLLPT